MRLFSMFFVLSTVIHAVPVHAASMSGQEIRNSIANKRVLLETRFGVEFPLFYAANGSVTGDGTGTGLGQYFAPKETGKWWIANDKLCQQFPTWNNGKIVCFQLENEGNNRLIWTQDNGRTGRAKIGS